MIEIRPLLKNWLKMKTVISRTLDKSSAAFFKPLSNAF